MTRWKLITGALLLACLAAAVPPAAMYLLSRNHAIASEQRHLALAAENSVLHADGLIQDAASALREIQQVLPRDCAQDHILAMRALVMSHRSVEEVGFYQNGRRTCSSWGTTDEVLHRVPPDYFIRNGIGVQLHVLPRISLGRDAIALQSGPYNVLLDPQILVDTVVDNNMNIALANGQGQIIATMNHPSPRIVRYAIAHPGSGQQGGLLYSTVHTQDWIAVTIENRSYIAADFRRQRIFMLPLGLLLAALIFLAALWGLHHRLSPAAELNFAIRNREFIAFYQPIVDLQTGRCIGAEALARWRRPGSGIIMPNTFIPFAEECGLIGKITDLMLNQITAEMGCLLRNLDDFHVAINLSAADVETGRPIASMKHLLRKHNIPPERLWLEITERAFIHPDPTRAVLAEARRQGHRILIDDFGTGYSSLSLLHSLPLDILKIDKSFIDSIGKDSALSLVIPHIIEMAKELNLKLIAEGVETEEQAAYCCAHGICYAQGWLYAKAMDRRDFLTWIEENHKVYPATYSGAG